MLNILKDMLHHVYEGKIFLKYKYKWKHKWSIEKCLKRYNRPTKSHKHIGYSMDSCKKYTPDKNKIRRIQFGYFIKYSI